MPEDGDLHDLLCAWTGRDLPAERRSALLERLAADPALLHDLAAETWMLAQIRAVQAQEPRWLRLADELGVGVGGGRDERLRQAVSTAPRLRRISAGPLAAVLAALLLLTVWPALSWRAWGKPPAAGAAPAPAVIAVITVAEAAWAAGDAHVAGDAIAAGPLRLASGHLTLALVDGVQIDIDGASDCELAAGDRLICRLGQVRVRAAAGTRGFVVACPHADVVDLGTEFAVDVAADGTASALVIDGQVEVALLDDERVPRSNEVIGRGQAARIDHRAGRIQVIDADPRAFARSRHQAAPALALDSGYPAAVRAAGPWGYWRFERRDGQRFPNEIEGGPDLVARGLVTIASSGDGNRCAVLADDPAQPSWLELDGVMPCDLGADYAFELWLARETPFRSVVASAFASPGSSRNINLLEVLSAVDGGTAGLRFLHRWPPGSEGGSNIIAPGLLPFCWRHVVGQRRGTGLELYIDGHLAREQPIADGGALAAIHLVLGRLDSRSENDGHPRRTFAGRIDEFAVYRHALSPMVIADHARRGRPAPDATLLKSSPP